MTEQPTEYEAWAALRGARMYVKDLEREWSDERAKGVPAEALEDLARAMARAEDHANEALAVWVDASRAERMSKDGVA